MMHLLQDYVHNNKEALDNCIISCVFIFLSVAEWSVEKYSIVSQTVMIDLHWTKSVPD